MANLQQFALNLLANSPQVNNNPQYKELIDVIRTGNSERGEQIANNILNSMGLTKDQALTQARNFFHI